MSKVCYFFDKKTHVDFSLYSLVFDQIALLFSTTIHLSNGRSDDSEVIAI